MKEAISTLQSVRLALDSVEVKGRQNHLLLIGCMNDIEKVIAGLTKEVDDSGDIHPEP